jgi:hypothetical protein
MPDDPSSQKPCPMRKLNCERRVIETEPPMNPPYTTCSNPDCPEAIHALAERLINIVKDYQ